METEGGGQEPNNSSIIFSQTDNSVEITPQKVNSEEDIQPSLIVEPRLENKKRNKSFQKKNREQMRNRIKNSLFSNSKNNSVACSMENLVDTLQQNQQLQLPEQSNSMNIISTSMVLSSDFNTCETSTQLAAPAHSKPNHFQTETHPRKQVFIRLQSFEDQDQIERDREQGIFKISGNFNDFYELKEILGEGCVGLVKKAVRKSDGQVFAVKTVRTRDEETIENIKQEFLHLKQLNHPNIVKVYELYIDNLSGKIHSVMELINGKEMFEVIHELGHYSELVASKIFSQILDAIAYMHQNYCCHRDLKPNNILCNSDGTEVKITDFNVSKFSDHYKNYQGGESIIHQSIKMCTYTGTMAFSAPEVFNEEICYDETIDMWSAGCILFTMLSGREPFQAEYVHDLVKLICQGKYNFDDPVWQDISSEAKDLISKCLTVDSTQRIKPEEALKHPFITRARVSSSFSSMTNECASPVKIPIIDIQQIQPFIEIEEERNEGVSTTPANANLCRKQLSQNIDRLIVNNSKKNKNLTKFSNERPRAVSSICIQLCNQFDYQSLLNNQQTLNGHQFTELENHEEQEEENDEQYNEEQFQRKRKKKFTMIFSKEDCFSNHADTDSSSNNLVNKNEQNKVSKEQTKNQSICKLPQFDSLKNRSTNWKKKSNQSSTQNLLEDSSQQQLDNQNMTTSSSSSSSLSSSLSPKNQSFSNSRNRNSKSKQNLYWNDEESENYSVSDFVSNNNDSKSKRKSNSKTASNESSMSFIKNAFKSFKKRFVFSFQRSNLNSQTQRSFSCDIQNSEDFKKMQENQEALINEINLLRCKENSNKNQQINQSYCSFTSGIEALSKLCVPTINRLINPQSKFSNSKNVNSSANPRVEINIKE
ncbi:Serine/Threonine kinase domain protein (macronuclear) [Tetrahymena thermophila SB210]|uniref:Serine/Threonine kinase domain protein n=1 Tax=Tetrahymena thermophila (strain SB210) TaxID=312017 RepID=Q22XN7_TETTS|nr:Serine/Threonine kinase domain protein [Tetrahymena thermophila SB210]EAR90042.2 Serine/Threonine kinase domain protein [Tetrahymena thermophila SB210]|eukprot:XP_001010287.2 Serine/Threonine kinase domain protein [Tetrahymena thermophila SB210]